MTRLQHNRSTYKFSLLGDLPLQTMYTNAKELAVLVKPIPNRSTLQLIDIPS